MGYDDILPLIGGFSRHQWKLCFLFSFPTIANVFFKIGNVLLVAMPKYRCRLPFETDNSSYYLNETELSNWYPYSNSTESYSSCSYFLNNTEQKCNDFIFDGLLGTTVSVEFKLTCEKDYLMATSNSLSMFGYMIGSFIFGDASDRWGRKRIFMVCGICHLLLGTALAFAPNIWTFLTLKVLFGIVVGGLFFTGYVLLIESTVPKKRALIGTSVIIYFALGYLICSLLGYISPTWKHLQIIYTSFGLPIIFYFWLLPESARWLISKNKHSEACKVIHSIAKENKVSILDENLRSLLTDVSETSDKKQKQISILDAMKYPTLRIRICILLFLSMVNFMVYFGVTWNVSKLSGNLYINFALLGLSDILTFCTIFFTVQKFGRKPIVSTYMILGGLSLVMLILKPSDPIWVMTWTLVNKLFIGATLNLSYVYNSEIYPTVLRNTGLGLNSITGGIGSMIAPYIFYLDTFWVPLPYVIFAVLLVFGGCMCQLLPETFEKKLPETLEEGETFETDT